MFQTMSDRIRAKIKARADQMYGEHVGQRCGRRTRLFFNANCVIIVVCLGGLIAAWLLIPEIGLLAKHG